MATYNSTHTGAQIDAAVTFGMAPDATPTAGSQKGVTSGGVYAELAQKQGILNFDATPTENSDNPVTSDGLFDALAAKAPIASPHFTGAPTAPTRDASDNSDNIATTSFVHTAVRTIDLNIADEYDASTGYSVGDVVMRNGLVYVYIGDNRMIYKTSSDDVYKTSNNLIYRVNQSQWGSSTVEQVSLGDLIGLLLKRVPAAPPANGTYTLQATVSGGVATYAWN